MLCNLIEEEYRMVRCAVIRFARLRLILLLLGSVFLVFFVVFLVFLIDCISKLWICKDEKTNKG